MTVPFKCEQYQFSQLPPPTTYGQGFALVVDQGGALFYSDGKSWSSTVGQAATVFGNTQNVVPASVFNKWRKALANVRNGTSDARILCVGDSTFVGAGDSVAGTIATSRSMPTRLASLLNSSVTPAVISLAVPSTNLGAPFPDGRWTLGSGWSQVSYGAASGAAYQATAAAGNLVYTPSPQVLCDGFYVYYLGNNSPALGTLGCTATGGSPTPINTGTLAAGTYRTLVAAGSASSSNSLTIANSVAGSFIVGVEPVLSTKSQVLVGNASVGYAATGNWQTPGTFSGVQFIQTVAPDLTLISLGINDGLAGQSVANYQTYMQNIINAAKNSGDVLLCDFLPNNSTFIQNNLKLYQPVVANLAASNNCAYLSIFNRWGGAYNANFMYSDGTHGNDQGYWDWAQFVANVIANP